MSRTRPPSLSLVTLVVIAVLVVTTSSEAAVFGPSRCENKKLAAAAATVLRVVKCHLAAAHAGAAVDPACLAAASAKLASAATQAEKGPCPTVGDGPIASGLLTALANDVAALVGGAASECDERKLRAAGQYVKGALRAQAAHAKAPEPDRLYDDLAKERTKLASAMAKAAAKGDCSPSGDPTVIGARADAGVADVVDAIRGTLDGLAARTGRTIGAAVRANLLASSETIYTDTVLRQLGNVTAEYEFMWDNMEPTQGAPDYGPIDTVVAFSQQHGLPLKGAPLVWHVILPAWVNDAMSAAELQAAVDDRIDTLMTRYAGVVTTWDVVNEAVVDFGAALRDSIFLQKLGPDYIKNAFVRARQADPNALLFYNDFLADGVNVKSDFIYDLIVGLLAQGTPIDGVSFQMHLGGGFGSPPTRESVRQNLQRFADLGLKVRISEMDVQVQNVSLEPADRYAFQRAVYHDMVAACLDVAACDSVSFWGITDKYTWITEFLHTPDVPLPFDRAYLPKAAFFGVRDALLGY